MQDIFQPACLLIKPSTIAKNIPSPVPTLFCWPVETSLLMLANPKITAATTPRTNCAQKLIQPVSRNVWAISWIVELVLESGLSNIFIPNLGGYGEANYTQEVTLLVSLSCNKLVKRY